METAGSFPSGWRPASGPALNAAVMRMVVFMGAVWNGDAPGIGPGVCRSDPLFGGMSVFAHKLFARFILIFQKKLFHFFFCRPRTFNGGSQCLAEIIFSRSAGGKSFVCAAESNLRFRFVNVHGCCLGSAARSWSRPRIGARLQWTFQSISATPPADWYWCFHRFSSGTRA